MSKDYSAFYELYRISIDSTYSVMAAHCRDVQSAKKLTEEAYRLSFRNLDKLKHPEEFSVWMYSLSVYIAEHLGNRKKGDFEIWGSLTDSEKETIWNNVINPPAAEKAEVQPLLSEEEIFRNVANISVGKAIVRRKDEKYLFAGLICCIFLILVFLLYQGLQKKTEADSPRYISDNIISSVDDGKVMEFARAVTGQLSGEIGEIYQLGEDTYYVVVYLGGQVSGGSVISYSEDKKTAEVISSSEDLLTDEQLSQVAEDEYLQVNYSSETEAVSSETAAAAAVHKAGTTEIDCEDNSVTLSDDMFSELVENAENEEEKLDELFGTDAFGQDYSIVLTIRCRNVNLRQTASVTLDSSVADEIGTAGKVRVVLGNERQVISISKEQLTQLCDAYDSLTVEITQVTDNGYDICFRDGKRNKISELCGTVEITFPADNELTYVYADYGSRTENRGGSFDENKKTITFSSSLSGSYTLIGNNAVITDMEDPDDDVLFMASTGFMQLDEEGRFRPEDYITRSELINAVAKMFLAVERDPSSDEDAPVLSDLDVSDSDYDYIAAGFYSSVVGGYSDGSFGGEMYASMEEVLTVCSRTLLSRNIEIPENGQKKTAWDYFTDADDISSYAVEHVENMAALGIIKSGDSLNPSAYVSRLTAAEILYKVYRILYAGN